MNIIAIVTLAAAAPAASPDLPALFGSRPYVESVSLAPKGDRLVFVTPGTGASNAAAVQDLASGDIKPVAFADGDPSRISDCGWAADDRIVCKLLGTAIIEKKPYTYDRLIAVDSDGRNLLALGRRANGLYYNPYYLNDGQVVDWLTGADGKILMLRNRKTDGMGLEVVDTRTAEGVEATKEPLGNRFLTDEHGSVRVIGRNVRNNYTDFTNEMDWQYRPSGSNEWRSLSKTKMDASGFRPLKVDGARDVVYALQKLNGKDALYRVSLNGSLGSELVHAEPDADIESIETIGRHGRMIGYNYTTDRFHTNYLDPAYQVLSNSLAKALPNLRNIVFESASSDEQKLLVYAGSETDPGHYLVYDRPSHRLTEVLLARPELPDALQATRRQVSFAAHDGTPLNAFLTLPKGRATDLPAIVLVYGGAFAHDHWGFNWLTQYFAAAGYAVIEPQFRGHPDLWRSDNGYKNWRTAVGDIVDTGRWLVNAGIADNKRLAIAGWSFGGYAALQASAIDANLFRAIVAVAPVSDLLAVRASWKGNANSGPIEEMFGPYELTAAGSPLRHANAFKAPVLLFHGDRDSDVYVKQSSDMNGALLAAGKASRLVIYPGLDHFLTDSDARVDFLRQTTRFLETSFGSK